MSVIKITKESMDRFRHDKDVVGARNRVPAPINNQADLHSDAMLMCLFDDAEYVEHQYNDHFVAFGFILEWPVRVDYYLGDNSITIVNASESRVEDSMIERLTKEIETRTTDEEVEPDMRYFENYGYLSSWKATFYYTDEWARENLG